MTEVYLIWSIEHGAWWKPDSNGYTESWDLAGRYSKRDAYGISARANHIELSEVPVPVSFCEYQDKFQKQLKTI